MDEGQFAADFIANNCEKIFRIGAQAFGKIDAVLQTKLKTAYSDYLISTYDKYSRSKSFFIRSQSVDMYTYYVSSGILCGNNIIKFPDFRNCVTESTRVVITGSGGSGKSVLMRHLFLNCIHDKTYAPLLIELRDLNSYDKSLDSYIEHYLDTYSFNIAPEFIKRAKTEGHFCFFFDGYDELNLSLRNKIARQIQLLSTKYPKCPVFLSSRPDDRLNGIDDFMVFQMQPLNVTTATLLVTKLPFDEDIKRKFVTDLREGLFDKHESFLSNPLLLSIMLLTYGENAEIPSKLSIFYNQAYEALYQRHDANKGGYSRERLCSLDIQDFSRVFSLLALQTYEKRLFKMSRVDCLSFIEKGRNSLKLNFKSEDFLSDLLSAACLLFEDGLEIAFSHRSFQEYFVAKHIATAPPEAQERLIERYWPNMRSDSVMSLLLEINPELVERMLILPKLEILFTEIGVKNRVGMTHMTKYFKKCYKAISVDERDIMATSLNEKFDYSAVVHMAVRHTTDYTFPPPEQFRRQHSDLLSKYGTEGGPFTVEMTALNSRSPILIDIFQSIGAFSIGYLEHAYSAYKKLKVKHANTVHDLDTLLGIK